MRPKACKGDAPETEASLEMLCDKGLTLTALRSHLFTIEAGGEPDRQIAEHLVSGCEPCARMADALEATEPFLLGQTAGPLTMFQIRAAVETK